LPEEKSKEKNQNGSLKYNLGSCFEFVFSVPKLLEICKDSDNIKKMYSKENTIQDVWNEETQSIQTPEKENAVQF